MSTYLSRKPKPTDQKTVVLSVSMPRFLVERLHAISDEARVPVSHLVKNAIEKVYRRGV